MNKVILLGRLTKEPEIRYSQTNNIKVGHFSLAINRKYVKQGEERMADFINIVTYSKLAEFTEKYLKKGIQICISGRLQTRNWEDQNGQRHFSTEVVAEEIDFADSIEKQRPDESLLSASTSVKTVNQETQQDDVIMADVDDLPF